MLGRRSAHRRLFASQRGLRSQSNADRALAPVVVDVRGLRAEGAGCDTLTSGLARISCPAVAGRAPSPLTNVVPSEGWRPVDDHATRPRCRRTYSWCSSPLVIK